MNPALTSRFRVAVVGSGPAAFFAAEHLLHTSAAEISVDMFERLPTPFGLVRAGVAPDHLKIKTVTRSFTATASHPRFRFFGNVEYGRQITLADLQANYHAALFATGAQSDRKMGIPGEDLPGSHPATEFVAWYNGHPHYRALSFDLSHERAVVVGVGNVAIDVARILMLTPAELAASDMAPHALEALSASKVREVVVVGRRGPAQAAFTNPELKELGELQGADVVVRHDEAQLDQHSREDLEASGDRTLVRKVEMLQAYARAPRQGRPRAIHLRFLLSPEELVGRHGRVSAITLGRNRLIRGESGALIAEPTGEHETIEAGLVFRSVGYRGLPLPSLPFHERWAVVPNDHGRVLDPESGSPLAGLYVAGWLKRGPSGVIGTNKPDAAETVALTVEDLLAGRHWQPGEGAQQIETLVASRQPRVFTFSDWQRLDELEQAAGTRAGRPRVKFTSVEAMLGALGRKP